MRPGIKRILAKYKPKSRQVIVLEYKSVTTIEEEKFEEIEVERIYLIGTDEIKDENLRGEFTAF